MRTLFASLFIVLVGLFPGHATSQVLCSSLGPSVTYCGGWDRNMNNVAGTITRIPGTGSSWLDVTHERRWRTSQILAWI